MLVTPQKFKLTKNSRKQKTMFLPFYAPTSLRNIYQNNTNIKKETITVLTNEKFERSLQQFYYKQLQFCTKYLENLLHFTVLFFRQK